jgi:hypothetical protein
MRIDFDDIDPPFSEAAVSSECWSREATERNP